jgi:hypothetical protein
MGKLQYILIFGMLGSGLAFAVAITAADLLEQPSRGWVFANAQLAIFTRLFRLPPRSEDLERSFCDRVPFPPLK